MSTREKILDSALQVFLSKGFERASMNDIVESSHFTKGAIYHHFKNKDEIFLEAMVRLFDEMENWYESVFKDAQSIKEIINEGVDSNKVIHSRLIKKYKEEKSVRTSPGQMTILPSLMNVLARSPAKTSKEILAICNK